MVGVTPPESSIAYAKRLRLTPGTGFRFMLFGVLFTKLLSLSLAENQRFEDSELDCDLGLSSRGRSRSTVSPY